MGHRFRGTRKTVWSCAVYVNPHRIKYLYSGQPGDYLCYLITETQILTLIFTSLLIFSRHKLQRATRAQFTNITTPFQD